MSSQDSLEPKNEFRKGKVEVRGIEEKVLDAEVLADPELLTSAFYGENAEHEMGLWESAKCHPVACFWAFIMCFTIVSCHICNVATRSQC